MLQYKLYGDGINDDTPAIQEMLDSGMSCVCLPIPKSNYLISKTLLIHSNQELKLDRFSKIKLRDNSNCAMLSNSDFENGNENIHISGGIWDMNNQNQHSNPYHYKNPDTNKYAKEEMKDCGYNKKTSRFIPPEVFSGICFIFSGVKHFYFENLTIVNPVLYGVDIAFSEFFQFENIRFDYYLGSPKLWNMDGIHIEGGCKFGSIRNLSGTTHDDMVAITSDDMFFAPIENITVENIYSEKSHSAVRLLSVKNKVSNIHISNVFGTFYLYCITLGKYFDVPERANFENIVIDNIYASQCEGTVDVKGNCAALIEVGTGVTIKKLTLSNISRYEEYSQTATVRVLENSIVEEMVINNAAQRSDKGLSFPFLSAEGKIKKLCLNGVECDEDKMFVKKENIDYIKICEER